MHYHWWLNQEKNYPWAIGKNVFTDEEIKKIIEIGNSRDKSSEEESLIVTGKNKEAEKDPSYRDCSMSWIRADLEENRWIFRTITDYVNVVNQEFYKYDLDCIQNLQFTKYNVGNFYKKHVDIQYESYRTRKLSFVIQLSDESDYEGGDLILHYSEDPEHMPKEKSTIIAFPSYAMHEVLPITKGFRYSLVGWVLGPNFK